MELWREVEGWEGAYEVSNTGRIRSVDRQISALNPHGAVCVRNYRGRVLRATRTKNGYLLVCLSSPERREHHYVHRLVAKAFLPPAVEGEEVCHNDGVRTHNNASNLRFDTRSSNALDRRLHGTMNPRCGEDAPAAKLTEEKVIEIRALRGCVSQRYLGRIHGVTHRTIGLAQRGETWRRVERRWQWEPIERMVR